MWRKTQIDEELRKIQLRVSDKLSRNLKRWQEDSDAKYLNERLGRAEFKEGEEIINDDTTKIYNLLIEQEIQKAIRDKRLPSREEMWRMPEQRAMIEAMAKK